MSIEKNEGCCSSSSCCGSSSSNKHEYTTGMVSTAVGDIIRIKSLNTFKDKVEHFRCRVSSFRNDYAIEPKLYALGNPDADSDVFVSANYKYSFDHLRRDLSGLNCWILVINTNGINVWCAAGKGTFGTGRIALAIKKSRLAEIISHKKIILPQLGAVGVSAHEIKKQTGFTVVYGPVYSKDIKNFINSGYTGNEEMRTIKFPFSERIKIAPLEFIPALKSFLWAALLVMIVTGITGTGIIFSQMYEFGLPLIILGLIAVLCGTVLIPLLLPFIPSKSFAVKGMILGFIPSIIAIFSLPSVILIVFSWVLFPAVSSYYSLLLTGSTTFTSPSGVEKELRKAIPLYFIALAAAIICLILYKLIQFGVLL